MLWTLNTTRKAHSMCQIDTNSMTQFVVVAFLWAPLFACAFFVVSPLDSHSLIKFRLISSTLSDLCACVWHININRSRSSCFPSHGYNLSALIYVNGCVFVCVLFRSFARHLCHVFCLLFLRCIAHHRRFVDVVVAVVTYSVGWCPIA